MDPVDDRTGDALETPAATREIPTGIAPHGGGKAKPSGAAAARCSIDPRTRLTTDPPVWLNTIEEAA